MKTIIETTIRIPINLIALSENMLRYGHKDVLFLIIGDQQTPEGVQDIAGEIERTGYKAEYWSLEAQQQFARGIKCLEELPICSGIRRNFGTYLAIKYGADAIYVDDDNWPIDGDFLGQHALGHINGILSERLWWNPLENLSLFARGFPVSRRGKPAILSERLWCPPGRTFQVIANQGLFVKTPDVDAWAHIDGVPKVVEVNRQKVILTRGHCPINTQNTAVAKEFLPAFFLPDIGRNCDIVAGYFLQRVAYYLGMSISVGPPVLEHRRNYHNSLDDLESELPGLRLIDKMAPILEILENPPALGMDVLETCKHVLEEFSCAFHGPVLDSYQEWFEGVARIA